MKAFAELIHRLDTTTKTSEKVAALTSYFLTATDQDKIWVLALFTGKKPKRTITSTLLKEWCIEYCDIPAWLFYECYHTVGDLSETIALLVNKNKHAPLSSHTPLHKVIEKLFSLSLATDEEKKAFMLDYWSGLDSVKEIFVFNKLLSGNFRIGVSQQLIVQALSKIVDADTNVLLHRLSGKWDPYTVNFKDLLSHSQVEVDISKPYPFYLAYAIDKPVEELGLIGDWQAEWKWDGIRGQLIKRKEQYFIWSRGEELLTERFPEITALMKYLPDGCVLDGEIICMSQGNILPFSILQQRIGRKQLSKKILEQAPSGFIAYDLLENNYTDLRHEPLAERRKLLSSIASHIPAAAPFMLSPIIDKLTWDDLTELRLKSREYKAEGFMLKQKHSPYQSGRKKGEWWKWKIDPYTIDAVLIYAQKGSGRRSNLYTDYTFAVRNGDTLVPFAKAYSGLTDKEIAKVDSFVKRHAIEKFGPVRTVKPELVFEIAFEGISASNRHKSGVAVRFPRIKRWRTDKSVQEINTLEDLINLTKEINF